MNVSQQCVLAVVKEKTEICVCSAPLKKGREHVAAVFNYLRVVTGEMEPEASWKRTAKGGEAMDTRGRKRNSEKFVWLYGRKSFANEGGQMLQKGEKGW